MAHMLVTHVSWGGEFHLTPATQGLQMAEMLAEKSCAGKDPGMFQSL